MTDDDHQWEVFTAADGERSIGMVTPTELGRRLKAAEDERDAFKAMLREVVEEFQDVRGYVPAYFWEKWDYDDVVAKAKRLLGDPRGG